MLNWIGVFYDAGVHHSRGTEHGLRYVVDVLVRILGKVAGGTLERTTYSRRYNSIKLLVSSRSSERGGSRCLKTMCC